MPTETGGNLEEALVRAIPEVSELVHQELTYWAPARPGDHILISNILVPFVVKSFDKNDQGVLHRCFELIERLADSTDRNTREVVAFSFCEALLRKPAIHSHLRSWMRPRTADLAGIVLDYYADYRKRGQEAQSPIDSEPLFWSLAHAVRQEREHGFLPGGMSRRRKAEQHLAALRRIREAEKMSSGDLKKLERSMADLTDALGSVGE